PFEPISSRNAGLENGQRVPSLLQGSARDADSVGSVEPPPNLIAPQPSGEQLAVEIDRRPNGLRRLVVQQLNAEVPHAAPQERRHGFGSALRYRVEERIAAANVGPQGVVHAETVAQLHLVAVAG